MPLRSAAVAPALAALLLLTATLPARADQRTPDAAQIRQAAEQFDAGIAARNSHDLEGAASRFEAADAAAPSAAALRWAIRARVEAGQLSRAATLSAQALARYPDDAQTTKLAHETLEKAEPKLHKLSVTCASPCVLAVGSRSIPGDASSRWTVYLDPGKTALGVSFSSGAASLKKDINATAGGATEARFEPDADASKPPRKAPSPDKPPPPDAPDKGIADHDVPSFDPPPPPDKPPPRSGLSPAFFLVGLIATAGVGGVTIWSAVDTQTNPGADAVRKDCAGKGVACPEYQEGLQKQNRTNILIGVSAGTAALTTVFAIFTNWHGSGKKPPGGAAVTPAAILSDHGAVALATGTF